MDELKTQTSADQARARLAMSMTAFALGMSPARVATLARGPNAAAFARQLAMYLCHVAFEMSLARVAAAFARDRSTVGHACHVIEDRRDDPAFDGWIASLENALRDAPAPPRDENAA
ncbi:MAG: helix-turn-helix domain-containing protein [Hyphomonadaceae bacterium]